MGIDFYKVSAEFMKNKVLEVENISDTPNTQLIYQIFAKILGDINCVDYTEVTQVELKNKLGEDVSSETIGDFFEKIKLLKEIGISSFGGTIEYQKNTSSLTDDTKEAFSSEDLKKLSIGIRSVKKLDIEFLNELFQPTKGIGTTISSEETTESILSELAAGIMLDTAASIMQYIRSGASIVNYIKSETDLTSPLFKEKQKNKIQNEITSIVASQAATGNLTSLSSVEEITAEVESLHRQKTFIEKFSEVNKPTGKLTKLGQFGRNISEKIQFTSNNNTLNLTLLPLETKDVTRHYSNFINGYEYYLKNALENNNFKFEDQANNEGSTSTEFIDFADRIKTSIENISAEIINRLGLDYASNRNESVGLDNSFNSNYSSYHSMRTMFYLMGSGLEHLLKCIDGSPEVYEEPKMQPFKDALTLLLLIYAGQNNEIAINFFKLHFWSNYKDISNASSLDLGEPNEDNYDIGDFSNGGHYELYNAAAEITYNLIANKLGQTLFNQTDKKQIFKDDKGIIKDGSAIKSQASVGKNQINPDDITNVLEAVIDPGWEEENIFCVSLLGFGKEKGSSSRYNFPAMSWSKTAQTGMSYDSKNHFQGPFKWITKNILELYPENYLGSLRNYNKYFEINNLIGADGRPGVAYEDAGISKGPLEFNSAQRSLTFFLIITKLLAKTCQGFISVEPDESKKNPVYKIFFDRDQIKGVIAALKNEQLASDIINSESAVTSYTIAREYRRKFLGTINRKNQNILNRIKGLLSIANDIVEVAKSYQRYFDIKNTDDYKLKTLYAFLNKMNYQSYLIDSLQFMNSTQMQTFSKHIDNFISASESEPIFGSNNNITDTQVKLMTIALSRPNYGYRSTESRGKKSILNIGIPTGLFDYLRKKAWIATGGNNKYLNSNYIAIQIFKNSFSPDNVSYYPKLIVFDMRKFTIENHHQIIPSQIENFQSDWSYDDLRNNFQFISYGNDESIIRTNAGTAGNTPAKRQMVDNHIADHYLKIYQQLTLGIDTNEYAFQIDPSLIADIALNIDNDAEALYNRFETYVIANYPSANIDEGLRYEFDRIKTQVKDSLFFKIKNKAKLLLSPKCFDRVFTVMINENDFMIDNDQLGTQHSAFENVEAVGGVTYSPNINSPGPISPESIFTFDNKIIINESSLGFYGLIASEEVKAHVKNNNGNDIPTMNQYFCNISILANL